tara:strand:- start:98 stop:787 length:690 start_codon:yes stop_codon:yes gene_type:complete
MAKLDNVTDVFANASVTTQSTSVAAGNLVIPTGDLPRFNQGNNVAEGAEVVYALLAAMHTAVNAAGNENANVSAGVSNTFNANALTMNRAFSFNTTLDLSSNIDDFDVKLDPSNIVPNLSFAGSDSTGTYNLGDGSSANIASIVLLSDGVSVNASSTDFTLSAVSDVDGNWVVFNDGGAYKLRLSDESTLTSSASPGTDHTVTIKIEDNRLGFDQFPVVEKDIIVAVIT